MYKWIQGTALNTKGRAIIYGSLFDNASRALADRSYWELPSFLVLANRETQGLLHTLHSADAIQKAGVSGDSFKLAHASSVKKLHAFAEQRGLRSIPFLPSYIVELPCQTEEVLPITPHEDVIYVGSFHNPLGLHQAIHAAATLYQTELAETLMRTGRLELEIQKIPHTFAVTSCSDLPEETPFIPYLFNRFLYPLIETSSSNFSAERMLLQEELKAFGKGTHLEESLCELGSAFVAPSCRPGHVKEFQAAHCALVNHIYNEAYEEAAEAQRLIDTMRV